MNLTQEKSLLVVRLLSLQGCNREILNCMMSNLQLKVFMFIKDSDNATSREVSKELNMSYHAVQNILTRLFRGSFLCRSKTTNSTQGGEYEYRIKLNLK